MQIVGLLGSVFGSGLSVTPHIDNLWFLANTDLNELLLLLTGTYYIDYYQ